LGGVGIPRGGLTIVTILFTGGARGGAA
jgi:hypothetical protein